MIKSFWKDPVLSQVIAYGVIALIVYLLKFVPGLSFLLKTIPIPVWLIIIVLIIFMVLIIRIIINVIKLLGIKSELATGMSEGELDIDGNTCSYTYDKYMDKLISYKIRCKNCNLLMEARNTAYFLAAGSMTAFICTSCGNTTVDYPFSLNKFEKELEKLAERKINQS